MRDDADPVTEASALTATNLKRLPAGHFALGCRGLRVFVTSFVYRYGLPRTADRVFRVRLPETPHVDTRCGLIKRGPTVAAHVQSDSGRARVLDGLRRWLEPLLRRYEVSNKTYPTIAIGCTSGRHRSVYVTERLAKLLRGLGRQAGLAYRDLPPCPTGAPHVMSGVAAASG